MGQELTKHSILRLKFGPQLPGSCFGQCGRDNPQITDFSQRTVRTGQAGPIEESFSLE